jgi:penicillin-insensitive murein endopeptidase
VDVWLKVVKATDQIALRELETEDMKAVTELGDDQIKMIKFFAQDLSVERIFINPAFKKKLCLDKKLTAEEHHKLRAWWGHDDHIHVRLKCPVDSSACISQKAIPSGDGCGEDLDWWFTDEAKAADVDVSWEDLKSVYLDKVEKLPFACSFYKETF